MVDRYLASIKNMGMINSVLLFLCHPLRSFHSSPSVGVFTSGRVGGRAVRDDFGLSIISIVIMITTTNADKVTVIGMSLSIMGSPM